MEDAETGREEERGGVPTPAWGTREGANMQRSRSAVAALWVPVVLVGLQLVLAYLVYVLALCGMQLLARCNGGFFSGATVSSSLERETTSQAIASWGKLQCCSPVCFSWPGF